MVVHLGQSFMRQSTVGWHLGIQWRYRTTSWKALKDLKESHPVETAEYAMAQEIDHDPELNWYVKAVPKKRLRIIYFVNKRNA